ncbi:NADH-quinone oxidoreductase subunit F [Providencia rettgeri]|uniref:NADH-quinone oxidoreductase subunit F n=1 Tax=Providencia rettgeri TaxID=587 RepID=A0A379FQE6_PRORE|nr:NADH-quinone oxidoreductase subunit F [Providencia rettgeri]
MPAILEHGDQWYIDLSAGKSKDAGTKLMGFSGRVKNPGFMGIAIWYTAREVLEDYAGGMRGWAEIKSIGSQWSRDRLPD